VSVDASTVRRIAHLARIAVAEEEIEPLRDELNAILAFVEQLAQVNVDDVEPMTSVILPGAEGGGMIRNQEIISGIRKLIPHP